MHVAINPLGLARPVGYSHGIKARGAIVALGGQIGWGREGALVSPDLVPQFEQALLNLLEVVRAAGGRADDLVSLTIYVTDRRDYARRRRELGAIWRSRVGRHYPAMALVEVGALLEEGALVELQGLAVVPDRG